MEKWRKLPGWENRYSVSSEGRVRSFDMRVKGRNGSTALRKGRTLTPVVKSGRYLCVTLSKSDRREQVFIHDLVALAFRGAKPVGKLTRHLDDNKLNNRATNIRYGTVAQNEADKARNNKVAKGERHGMVKLTEVEIHAIRKDTRRGALVAAGFGVTTAHVWAIRSRRVWKHI